MGSFLKVALLGLQPVPIPFLNAASQAMALDGGGGGTLPFQPAGSAGLWASQALKRSINCRCSISAGASTADKGAASPQPQMPVFPAPPTLCPHSLLPRREVPRVPVPEPPAACPPHGVPGWLLLLPGDAMGGLSGPRPAWRVLSRIINLTARLPPSLAPDPQGSASWAAGGPWTRWGDTARPLRVCLWGAAPPASCWR